MLSEEEEEEDEDSEIEPKVVAAQNATNHDYVVG